jgi:23S rRNA (cytidine1920-2'-O)/16S rRNA (cytidine1409-2'-O)-methyltransferase
MAKQSKSRLDEILVRRGFADAIATARAMIMSGDIIVDDQRIDKAGTMVDENATIRMRDEGRFVSRGGDKLLAAIEDFNLRNAFNGKLALDIGASTGGFTDCLLTLGVSNVTALDVGTAQLAWKLRQDPRVHSIEKTDVKNFTPDQNTRFDWVVADVSFTSLAKLIPEIHRIAADASLLLLIKPQFELPRDMIPDGGVVTNDEHRQIAVENVKIACIRYGYSIEGVRDARVAGRQGNREVFILCRPSGQSHGA